MPAVTASDIFRESHSTRDSGSRKWKPALSYFGAYFWTGYVLVPFLPPQRKIKKTFMEYKSNFIASKIKKLGNARSQNNSPLNGDPNKRHAFCLVIYPHTRMHSESLNYTESRPYLPKIAYCLIS